MSACKNPALKGNILTLEQKLKRKINMFQTNLYCTMNLSGRWFVDALLFELDNKCKLLREQQPPYQLNKEFDLGVLDSMLDNISTDDTFIKQFANICNKGAKYGTEIFIGVDCKPLNGFYNLDEIDHLNDRAKDICASEFFNIDNMYNDIRSDIKFCYYLAKYYVGVFWWLHYLSRYNSSTEFCSC